MSLTVLRPVMIDFDYRRFPSTRYQGSKRRLLPWIKSVFDKIEFSSSLDLFGGTGAVSYLLKTLGKEVTFNDYLRFNCVLARALIKNNSVKLSKKKFNSLFQGIPIKGIVSEIFKDIYYTDKENEQIDTLIHRILFDSETGLTGYSQDIALHSLFQALLMKRPFNLFHRSNLNLRLNDVERNFGNKTTWEKPIKELMEKNLKEVNKAIFGNGKKHIVINKDALQVNTGYDLIYIDPPYYPSDTYKYVDYLNFYHFLEGICIYDEWKDHIDFDKKNLSLRGSNISFKKKSFICDMEELLELHKESIIVLSYKSPGYPSIKEIKRIMKKTHKEPQKYSIEYSYSLSKNNGHYKENLIVGYPRT